MVDTHAHLNCEDFAHDRAEVIRRSFGNGVKKIINASFDYLSSRQAVEMADERENIYAAVGLHPDNVKEECFDLAKYRELARNKRVVAIGETGLDYHRINDQGPIIKNLQKELFLKHLELARELELPIILHCRGSKESPRGAYEELMEILQAAAVKTGQANCEPRAVIHCFSADWEIAQKFLNLGFYLGFTGNITYPVKKPDAPAAQLLAVVKNAPLDRILTETDCPYLAPQSARGQRNEPQYVRFVLEKIAEVKNLSFGEAEEITVQNAEALFKI